MIVGFPRSADEPTPHGDNWRVAPRPYQCYHSVTPRLDRSLAPSVTRLSRSWCPSCYCFVYKLVLDLDKINGVGVQQGARIGPLLFGISVA